MVIFDCEWVMKLEKVNIEEMVHQKGGRQDIRWCSDPKGFGIRIYPSGTKTFVLSYRFRGRKYIRKLGKYGILTVEQARNLAKQKLREISGGKDPFEPRVSDRNLNEEVRNLQAQLLYAENLVTVGTFIPGMVHELNDLLTSVLAFSELIQDSEVLENPEAKENLSIIIQKAQRSGEVLKNISGFIRNQKPTSEFFQINDLISRVLGLKAYQLKIENVEVKTELDRSLPPYWGNISRLEHVLLNLISASEQKIGEDTKKGQICVRTVRQGHWIRILVEDDGPPIPEEMFPRLFNPFHGSGNFFAPFGLGLSICNRIVSELGGVIFGGNLTATRGVRFSIALPIAVTAADSGQGTDKEPSHLNGTGKVALVVDDEESIVEFLVKIFRKNHFEVESATNGQKALEIVKNRRVDLVVSDVRMPDMDGIRLFREIEKIRPVLSKNVVFISGAADTHLEELIAVTDARLIRKPFGREQILQIIRDVFAKH